MCSVARTCSSACGAKANCPPPTTCSNSSKPWIPHSQALNSKPVCGVPTPITSPRPVSSNAGPAWSTPHERCPNAPISNDDLAADCGAAADDRRLLEIARYKSEEHTSELQSLMRISYAVFCLKKKKHT